MKNQKSRRSTANLRLSRKFDLTNLESIFEPMGLPNDVTVSLEDVWPRLLIDLGAGLEIAFRPGLYDLPLSFGKPCVVNVPQGCKVRGRVSVGRPPRVRDRVPVIQRMDFTIDPPIVFENIVFTFFELNRVFRDKGMTALLEALKAGLAHTPLHEESLARGFLDLGLSAAGTRARDRAIRLDRSAKVVLSRFSGRPVQSDGAWRLALSWSGVVRCFGAVPVPFRRVRLPSFVLPSIHASIEKLLSGNPLASASLLNDQVPAEALAGAFANAIDDVDCRFRASGRLPRIDVEAETILRSIINMEVETPEKFSLVGEMSARRDGRRFVIGTEGLDLAVDDRRLRMSLSGDLDPARLLDIFMKGRAGSPPEEEVDPVQLALKIEKGSGTGGLKAVISIGHPLVDARTELPVEISDPSISGHCSVAVGEIGDVTPGEGDLRFSFGLNLPADTILEDATSRWVPGLEKGQFKGRAEWDAGQAIALTLDGRASFSLAGTSAISAMPELSIDDGEIETDLAGELRLAGSAKLARRDGGTAAADLAGTRFSLRLKRARIALGGRKLILPERSILEGVIRRGELDTSGLGALQMEIRWDLRGRSPILRSEGGDVELFVEALRSGEMTMNLSESGGLSFEGKRKGLYDARFFNALVNPEAEPGRLSEVMESDEAVEHVLAALGVFVPDIAEKAATAHKKFRQWQTMLRADGVKEPRHVIPRLDMARILSKLLTGSEDLVDRFVPVIRGVTDGNGLDRLEVKKIVNELYPDHEYAFELDRGLRWLDHIMSPVDPLPPPSAREEPPLVEDPAYRDSLEGLPAAGDTYAVIEGKKEMPEGFSTLIAGVAPYLALEQIETITARVPEGWRHEDLARLAYIGEIKKRIRMISEGYGGVGYTFQAMAIAFFLGDAVGKTSGDGQMDEIASLRSTDMVLGPEDAAMLLQAGMALPWHSSVVQINQRLLLDYIGARPASFLQEILVEMAGNSPRVLAGLLFALLEQDQSLMKNPVDIAALFSERLGIHVPRRSDYMAGRKWARDSYYEATLRVAEYVLENADPYRARKERLQVHRHPVDGTFSRGAKVRAVADVAQKAVKKADDLGGRCAFSGKRRGPRAASAKAYEASFRACSDLLRADRYAFHRSWFKAFWKRNHEALVVLSVVRNYQDDVDRVRNWLHVRSGRDEFADEQGILEAVIDALFHFDEDRRALKADPLVRLLLDPPPGKYDFTIVSAMGIITEGARGKELEKTFRRLKKQRGVRTIRADTQTMKSLEFNAKKVEEAVRRAKTPWGYVGYSQGCANGLKTESMLRGGTPEQQKLLEGLRCRNLLFGAHNGSAHGTGSSEKIRRAMVEGELILKHYQAIYSSWAIDMCLKGIKQVLDSQFFVHFMGGAESISHEGCVSLSRDGQFLGHVPTSTVRGVVTPEILPEALEFLSNVLTRQVDGARHDTQVTLVASVGYPTLVENESTRVLKRCDTGSAPQTSHHWSPLLEETRFLTTQRDIEGAIYDFPKDRHIFPWIEVNARFGIIERVEEEE